MLSEHKLPEQKTGDDASSYDKALHSVQVVAEESYESNCDTDAFAGPVDGFAKLIFNYIRPEIEPIIVHNLLSDLCTLMKLESGIPKDHRLLKACEALLIQHKETKDHPLLTKCKLVLESSPTHQQNEMFHHAAGTTEYNSWVRINAIYASFMLQEVDLNTLNSAGETVLHQLIKSIDTCARRRGPGSLDLFNLIVAIKCLILYPRVSLTIKDKEGHTALDYIFSSDKLTLVAIHSGKVSPTSLFREKSVLSQVVRWKLYYSFQYILTKTNIDLNKEGPEFVCRMIKANHPEMLGILLQDVHFTPFREKKDEASQQYNTEVVNEVLKNPKEEVHDILRHFICHPNSSAFVQDEKDYDRLSTLATGHPEVQKIFMSRKDSELAQRALLENDFKKMEELFNHAKKTDKLTFSYFVNHTIKRVLLAPSLFTKEQREQFISCIAKQINCPFETCQLLTLFYTGHAGLIKADLIFAEYFHNQATKLARSDKEKNDLEQSILPKYVCPLASLDSLESSIAELASIANKKEDDIAFFICSACRRRPEDMRTILLNLYGDLHTSTEPDLELAAALRRTLDQMPHDFKPIKKLVAPKAHSILHSDETHSQMEVAQTLPEGSRLG